MSIMPFKMKVICAFGILLMLASCAKSVHFTRIVPTELPGTYKVPFKEGYYFKDDTVTMMYIELYQQGKPNVYDSSVRVRMFLTLDVESRAFDGYMIGGLAYGRVLMKDIDIDEISNNILAISGDFEVHYKPGLFKVDVKERFTFGKLKIKKVGSVDEIEHLYGPAIKALLEENFQGKWH